MNVSVISKAALAAYAFVGVVIFTYAVAKTDLPSMTWARWLVFYALPLAFFAGMLWALRLSPTTRLAIAINVGVIPVVLYGFQGYQELNRWLTREQNIKDMEIRTGQPFDRRTPGDVIASLRAQGVEAFPPGAHILVPSVETDGGTIYPRSGRALRETVLCNESGSFVTYRADRYGFNNPDDLWNSQSTDIVAIGDSMTHGYCVDSRFQTVSRLREQWPQSLNLGIGSTGTLSHYAILREYAALARPRIVLWFYYENDLQNLLSERLLPANMRYLSGNGRFGLAEKQAVIDAAIDKFIADVLSKSNFDRGHWTRKLVDSILLRKLREKLGLNLRGVLADIDDPAQYDSAVTLFARIMEKARDDVATWGGRLYFVFLPSIHRYIEETSPPLYTHYRDRVLAEVAKLDIPAIDIHPAMARNPQARNDYFFYAGSHYSPEGYALATQLVTEALRHAGPVGTLEIGSQRQ